MVRKVSFVKVLIPVEERSITRGRIVKVKSTVIECRSTTHYVFGTVTENEKIV